MKLIPDAWRVVILAYSFWFNVLGLLVLIAPEILFAFTGIDMDPVLRWCLVVGLLIAGLAGRLVRQTSRAWVQWLRMLAVLLIIILASLGVARADVPDRGPLVAGAAVSEAQIMAVALPHIEQWEGMRLKAYLDIVGVPTICAGTTRGVHIGMTKTRAQCVAIMQAEALEYWRGVSRYLTKATLKNRITASRGAAWSSFAINVGISSAGRSTATRRLNAGNVTGACEALTWWNKAGGRVILGLVNRRSAERGLCLSAA
ncbi:lysozyme [Thioclava sp. GXIMD2076]|uniref:lysozyme n=1 Tax=Thioclava sp. GXIMD2076 TaxID=3131931 RepID=UPI0030D229D6